MDFSGWAQVGIYLCAHNTNKLAMSPVLAIMPLKYPMQREDLKEERSERGQEKPSTTFSQIPCSHDSTFVTWTNAHPWSYVVLQETKGPSISCLEASLLDILHILEVWSPCPPVQGPWKVKGPSEQWKVNGYVAFMELAKSGVSGFLPGGAVEQVVKEQGWLLLFWILLCVIP